MTFDLLSSVHVALYLVSVVSSLWVVFHGWGEWKKETRIKFQIFIKVCISEEAEGYLSTRPLVAGCPPGSTQETPGSGRSGPAPRLASGRRWRMSPFLTRDFVSLFRFVFCVFRERNSPRKPCLSIAYCQNGLPTLLATEVLHKNNSRWNRNHDP